MSCDLDTYSTSDYTRYHTIPIPIHILYIDIAECESMIFFFETTYYKCTITIIMMIILIIY